MADQVVRMIPCKVTAVGPLQVQLTTGDTLSGVPVLGVTYTVGAAAVALWTPPNPPVILTIGP